uniref:Uncharacterized protein AlNc14C11G1408 n=1 Tax=Albugo laibachii Nc14 TaxID=890382 RepID=F0W330_9STRA|nr:hypothetical protein PITG_06654 [Albugo laibachii Nc14]|eukprot:CCA15467.1 hypothetical protein PITG_06654 [Albugo laibachii Nc14]
MRKVSSSKMYISLERGRLTDIANFFTHELFNDELLQSMEGLESDMKIDIDSLTSKIEKSADQRSVMPPADETISGVVDYFVIIGPDATDLMIESLSERLPTALEPNILFSFPPEQQFAAQCLEHFCFPRGILFETDRMFEVKCDDLHQQAERYFILILSGGGSQGQNIQYACCLQRSVRIMLRKDGLTMSVPICYCAITRKPLLPFFRDVLSCIANMHGDDCKKEKPEHLLNMVSDMYVQSLCDSLSKLIHLQPSHDIQPQPIYLFSEKKPFVLYSSHADNGVDNDTCALLHWGLPQLLSYSNVDRIIEILVYLLREMKVIVVCDDPTRLSSFMITLSALLWPLKWAGPIVINLPPFLAEYLDAPVPIFCGVDRLPRGFKPSSTTVSINLDKVINRTCEDYSRLDPSQCWLPQTKALCDDLKYAASLIETEPSEGNLYSTSAIVDVMCRRVRLHIENWVNIKGEITDGSRFPFTQVFLKNLKQTQMYQRYHDDNHFRVNEVPVKADRRALLQSRQIKKNRTNDLHQALIQLFEVALY